MAREVLRGPRRAVQQPHHALCRQTAGAGPGRGRGLPPPWPPPQTELCLAGEPGAPPHHRSICEPRERRPQSTTGTRNPGPNGEEYGSVRVHSGAQPAPLKSPALTREANGHEVGPRGQTHGHSKERQWDLLHHLQAASRRLWGREARGGVPDPETCPSPALGPTGSQHRGEAHVPASGGGCRRPPRGAHQGLRTLAAPGPRGRRQRARVASSRRPVGAQCRVGSRGTTPTGPPGRLPL